MKPRHLLLAAGVCLAGGLALLGDRTPGDAVEPVQPVRQAGDPTQVPSTVPAPMPAAMPAPQRGPPTASREPEVLAIIPRSAPGEDVIGAQARPLFASQSWAPPPPKVVPPPPPPPPPPPTAPPLPFIYLGKQISDGQWSVFLARGDSTFIATVGAVLDNRYRVDSVAPPVMTLTYLPLKQVQQLSIGVHN